METDLLPTEHGRSPRYGIASVRQLNTQALASITIAAHGVAAGAAEFNVAS